AVAPEGFSKFVAAFWMVFPFMVGCYLFGGLSHGVKNTLFRTLIHQRIEPARHGQAFAAYNGLRNGAELIALAFGGALVAAIGGAGTLWLAGGAAGAAGLGGVLVLAAPDRPDRVDHPAGREAAAGRPLCVPDFTAAEQAALLEDRRPAGTVDRAVDSPAAQQARVRSVDDRVDRLRRDVAANDLDQAL